MKKILVVFGTRPELIKLAPLVAEIQKSNFLSPVICSTGQHKELLSQALHFFKIQPHFSLEIMRANQDLLSINQNILGHMKEVIEKSEAELTVVQGDTTTAFVSALCSFYLKIPVAHVEAGLRTFDKYSPFPEEMNRSLISKIADLHFAPTALAKSHLLKEGINPHQVFQVGNTGIDALLQAASSRGDKVPKSAEQLPSKNWILLTAHRRENFGEPFLRIVGAIKQFIQQRNDYHVIFPVHPNPNIKEVASKSFKNCENISLIEPLEFGDLAWFLKRVKLVITDSGGLQEEAPTFGKPVLVLRESTERTEAIDAGCAKLVGTDPKLILSSLNDLTAPNPLLYRKMAQAKNPFGDGTASKQIVKILETFLALQTKQAA